MTEPVRGAHGPIAESGYDSAEGEDAVRSRLWSLLLAVFCFCLGLFLVLWPWTPLWPVNYFVSLLPGSERWWLDPHVRGAVSGVGVVNLYLSLLEAFPDRR